MWRQVLEPTDKKYPDLTAHEEISYKFGATTGISAIFAHRPNTGQHIRSLATLTPSSGIINYFSCLV